MECAEAGAAGYVPAEASIEDLVTAIERITRSELACSPRVAAQLFNRIATGGDQWSGQPSPAKILTAREHQVLYGIRQGQSNKEIGEALSLSALTVKSHLSRIGRKLGTGDRAQMVALAMRAGVIR